MRPTPRPGDNGLDFTFSNPQATNAALTRLYGQTGIDSPTWIISGSVAANTYDEIVSFGIFVDEGKLNREVLFQIHSKSPLRVGQKVPLIAAGNINQVPGSQAQLQYREANKEVNQPVKRWISKSGTLTIVSIAGGKLALRVDNAVMAPAPRETTPQGLFTMNGTTIMTLSPTRRP